MEERPSIRALSREALETYLSEELGEPRYRAQQIMRWLFAEGAEHWSEMSNLSKGLRQKLQTFFELPLLPAPEEHLAQDGTNKLAYPLADGSVVETVLIPSPDRLTLCVSSQIGCKFRCAFCKTGSLGFGRNLTADEILSQVLVAQKIARREGRRISNLVFMGMGEPFDNLEALTLALKQLLSRDAFDFSKRKITVSTVGHVPGIEAFAREDLGVNLAISLHAANDALRSEIMPANKAWPLSRLFGALRAYPLAPRQRFTFEYIVIKGLNHSLQDAKALTKLLHGLPSKVNLIAFNPFEGSRFERPSEAEVLQFQEQLLARGLATSLRISRGGDKLAACGQLGRRRPNEQASAPRPRAEV